jgi:hypothetical protein
MAVEGERSRGARQRRWNLNGTSYGSWKYGRGGVEVWLFSEVKRGMRRGSSMVSEANDTPKSCAAAGRSKVVAGV